MNVLNKPIELIATFDQKGMPLPIRFKWITEDESRETIVIDRIIHKELIRSHHTKAYYCFLCESCINNQVMQYEIRYIVDGCQWILYRM